MLRCSAKVLTRGCLLLTKHSVASTGQPQLAIERQPKYNSLDWDDTDVLDQLHNKNMNKNTKIHKEQRTAEDNFLKAAYILLSPQAFDDLIRCIKNESEIGGTLGTNKLISKVEGKLRDMFHLTEMQSDCPLNKLVDLLKKCRAKELSINHNLYVKNEDPIDETMFDSYEKSDIVSTACMNIFSTRRNFNIQEITDSWSFRGDYDKITSRLENAQRPIMQLEAISTEEMVFNNKLKEGNFVRRKLNQIEKEISMVKDSTKEKKKMQSDHQNIAIERIGRDSLRPSFGSNWVYVYDLPYELKEEETKKMISMLEDQHCQIRNILKFPFSQMIQKNAVLSTKKMHLPEDMNFSKNFSEDHMVQINGLFQTPVEQASVEQQEKKETKKKMSKMQSTILKNRQRHLHKSYSLLQLASETTKQRLLSPEMRLFGLHLDTCINAKFQCALEKKSLQLRNIPWGTTIGQLVEAVNEALKNHDIQFRMTHEESDKVLTKGTVTLNLNSFYEVMLSLNALSDLTIRNYKVKPRISYGALHSFAGQLVESKSVQQRELIKQRLMKVFEARVQYSNRMNERMSASLL